MSARPELPRPMATAPKDGTDILLLTGDFGWVEGRWNAAVISHRAEIGSIPVPVDEIQGDWESDWQISAGVPGNDPKDSGSIAAARRSAGCPCRRHRNATAWTAMAAAGDRIMLMPAIMTIAPTSKAPFFVRPR